MNSHSLDKDVWRSPIRCGRRSKHPFCCNDLAGQGMRLPLQRCEEEWGHLHVPVLVR